MSFPWILLVSGCAGGLLGVLYFEGLWFTTVHMTASRRRWLLWLLSFVLRTASLGAGLVLLASAGWQHLAAGCLGVLGGRTVVVRRHWPRPVAGGLPGGL